PGPKQIRDPPKIEAPAAGSHSSFGRRPFIASAASASRRPDARRAIDWRVARARSQRPGHSPSAPENVRVRTRSPHGRLGRPSPDSTGRHPSGSIRSSPSVCCSVPGPVPEDVLEMNRKVESLSSPERFVRPHECR
ncbi:unnamed protein product, partial [Ixodes hexagonus]